MRKPRSKSHIFTVDSICVRKILVFHSFVKPSGMGLAHLLRCRRGMSAMLQDGTL